jgi:CRISPR-associated protein Csd2
MFENNNASGRFGMGVEKFYVFKHNNRLGSFPCHKLHQAVQIKLKDGVTHPRSTSDYTISIDETIKQQFNDKVELIELV